ncbi:MAG: hypothetical protein ACRD16_05095 [Thermoanaerobaculia bacterium]
MVPRNRSQNPGLRFASAACVLLSASLAAAQDASYPTARVSAFADLNVSRSTTSDTTDLDFGELDPYGEIQLSDSWSALAEGLIQRHERGSRTDVPGRRKIELDLERLLVAYSPSDALRLQVGEVSSGIVEWNEREQLPRFLQTPIDVPAIAKRQEQGGAWPLHLIGGWLSGRVNGSAGLRYGVGIGEGRGTSRDDIAPLTGPTSAAGLFSVAFAPTGVPGWEIGGAALLDDIPAPEGTYRERDVTLSTSYLRGPVEIRGEWSRMDHRLPGGPSHTTWGWYALFSSRLPGQLHEFRPYLLLDRLNVAANEPYLADVSDERAWAAGVRWDATGKLVVKFDFRSQRSLSPELDHRLRLQIAVAF